MRDIKETKKNGKAGVPLKAGFVIMAIVAVLVIANTVTNQTVTQKEEPVWQVIQKLSSLGAEADPGADESGWLATWCYDYAETPSDDNATDGNYDTWTGNVSGYQSTDDADAMDLASEDPFYFVVRARFSEVHCSDAGTLMSNRCRIALTVSGDETISDVYLYGHDTDLAGGGGAFVCSNDTAWLYINFYWDDNSDGYRITDDGTLAWNITISGQW